VINVENNLYEIVSSIQKLTQKARKQYHEEVNIIIKQKSVDTTRIELVLDNLLGFCFDEKILKMFKKLLRYYYSIDREATASYVNVYREIYGESDEA
jgi:hypothetical protein